MKFSTDSYRKNLLKFTRKASYFEKEINCSGIGEGPYPNSLLMTYPGFKNNFCATTNDDQSPIDQEGIIRLARYAQDFTTKANCKESQETPILSGECAEQFVCNAMRSAANLVTFGAFTYLKGKILKGSKVHSKDCLLGSQSSCFTEFAASIAKFLWESIKTIGFLAKSSFDFLTLGMFKSKDVRNVEEVSKEKMLMAANLTEAELEKFKNNPENEILIHAAPLLADFHSKQELPITKELRDKALELYTMIVPNF